MLDVDAVCETFGLGAPAGGARPVRGGLLNRTWRVETERGAYFVKRMNHRWIGDHDVTAWIERSCRIELAAIAAGVSAPEPVAAPGGACCAELDGRLVRVHRWVDGETPPPGALSATLASHVASQLARLHELRLGAGEHSTAELFTVRGEAGWQDLVGLAADTPFQADLRTLVARLVEAEEMATRLRAEPLEVIHTHRDVGQKNLLVHGSEVVLVDWEAAGPWTAELEVGSAALDLAAAGTDEADLALMRSFASAYRASGGTFAGRPESFCGWLNNTAGWLWFNVRRYVDPIDADERALARREVSSVLRYWPRVWDASELLAREIA